MIENEKQLEVTKNSLVMFEEAIANFDRKAYTNRGIHKSIANAYLDSLKNIRDELSEKIAVFEGKLVDK